MKKYLVLGSSGQIGSQLVKYLKNKGHHVFEFDIMNGSREDLRIPNNSLLRKHIEECDFVFFLAFDVGGSRYLFQYQDTYDFIHNNVFIMGNTFEELQRSGKPFIFASSQMSDMGYSTYGLCKAMGERYTDSMGGINVRLWNVYGYEKDLEKSHVITDFIRKAKNEKSITMLTDGTEERQFLYAEDCCSCLYTLSKKYESLDRSKKYHVTSFEWITIKNVAEEICSNFPDVNFSASTNKDMVHKGWKTEPDKYILNFWKPKVSLDEGIKKVIEMMESE